MTAVVVLENSKLTDIVEVSKKAGGTGGSRLGLKSKDKITVNDLLYGLLLCSGNDAAVALAEHVGGSVEGFANIMNTKAKQIGLENTSFVTPHGLDSDNHYTTAYELAKLTDYALEIQKFAQIVNTKDYTVNINKTQKKISNTNELLGNLEGVNGVKTGFTNGANRCLVTSVKRTNMNIITVVLGADTKKFRTSDSVKLINYAYNNYEIINVKKQIIDEFNQWKNINEKRIKINKGKINIINLKTENIEQEYILVKKIDKNDIDIRIDCTDILEAPVEKSQVVGNIRVYANNKQEMLINIICDVEIPRMKMNDYYYNLLKNYSKYLEAIQN